MQRERRGEHYPRRGHGDAGIFIFDVSVTKFYSPPMGNRAEGRGGRGEGRARCK